jgi:hypothetical protein
VGVSGNNDVGAVRMSVLDAGNQALDIIPAEPGAPRVGAVDRDTYLTINP